MTVVATFKYKGVVYSHSNATLTITPLEGQSAGVPFRIQSLKSWSAKPGLESEGLPGSSLEPVAIVNTAGVPDWEAELSVLAEERALLKHFGPGAATIPANVELTWQRQGLPTQTDYVKETLITRWGDSKSDTGSGPSSTIGGKAVKYLPSGVDLTDRNAQVL